MFVPKIFIGSSALASCLGEIDAYGEHRRTKIAYIIK